MLFNLYSFFISFSNWVVIDGPPITYLTPHLNEVMDVGEVWVGGQCFIFLSNSSTLRFITLHV